MRKGPGSGFDPSWTKVIYYKIDLSCFSAVLAWWPVRRIMCSRGAHVYPCTVVLVGWHHSISTKCIGIMQSGHQHHNHLNVTYYRHAIPDKWLTWSYKTTSHSLSITYTMSRANQNKEINQGSQNVFKVLTLVDGYWYFIPSRNRWINSLISANLCYNSKHILASMN